MNLYRYHEREVLLSYCLHVKFRFMIVPGILIGTKLFLQNEIFFFPFHSMKKYGP